MENEGGAKAEDTDCLRKLSALAREVRGSSDFQKLFLGCPSPELSSQDEKPRRAWSELAFHEVVRSQIPKLYQAVLGNYFIRINQFNDIPSRSLES